MVALMTIPIESFKQHTGGLLTASRLFICYMLFQSVCISFNAAINTDMNGEIYGALV